jgi:hypothetical protein
VARPTGHTAGAPLGQLDRTSSGRSDPDADCSVALVTARSENVRNEISYALEQGKIIIPVLYKDCVVPLQLQRAQRIDFRADYARGLSHLLEHLHVSQPDPSVLQKAAEGDAQRQAAWQAREREAQRIREIARGGSEGGERKEFDGGARKKRKQLAIAGGVVVALIVSLAVYLMQPKPQPTPPPPVPNPNAGVDPIVGCYLWFNNAPVVIRANHTISGGPFTGSWQEVSSAQRAYTFTWPQVSVDTVVVSANQQSLNGMNQYGIALSGTRISGRSGLIGSWSAISGVPTTIAVNPDGSYTAATATGTFKGTWQPKYGAAGTYTMSGQDLPKDSVMLSADGTHISGADQFGVAISGTRTGSCGIQ